MTAPAARYPSATVHPLTDPLPISAESPLHDALRIYADEYETAGPCRRAWLRDVVAAAGRVGGAS